MTTLTEAERDEFCICPYAHDTADDAENAALVAGCDRYLNDVIAPLAARLASVKALALHRAMARILETRDEDEDGPDITQGMTNAASIVALCIAELACAAHSRPRADCADCAVLGSDAHAEQKGAGA